ncbi:recombinase RecT, partial [Mycolicibacterium goodii]|uniref:recombinase RecT n=1 Tax=Mycolicibacterium goodii TaxID=134601 RepID=UPI001BDC5BF1
WKERADGSRYKVERFVTKYTIQTGIDGYRKNGREAAKAYGDVLAFDGPWFTGEDDFHVTDDGEVIQHWRKVWPNGNPPHAARYVVYRNGEPFEGIAHFDEFVQTNAIYEGSGNQRRKVGEEPNSMWAKMPRNQIAKCAEALAWRRAYPDDFAGLILEDSAQPTVIDQDGNIESAPASTSEKRRPAGSGISGVRAARERKRKREQVTDQDQVIEGEVVDETPADSEPAPADEQPAEQMPQPEPSQEVKDLRKSGRARLNAAIFATFGELGLNGDDKRDDRLVVIREIIRRDIESTKELTDEELQTLRNVLISRKQDGTLDADVTEWLNLETIRQDAAAADAGAAEASAGPGDGDTSGEGGE